MTEQLALGYLKSLGYACLKKGDLQYVVDLYRTYYEEMQYGSEEKGVEALDELTGALGALYECD